MCDYQQAASDLCPDGYVSIFLVGMVRVIDRNAQSVLENSRGLAEVDMMFSEVFFRLHWIPFKVNHERQLSLYK
jgi:hypothetical protein